MHEELILRGLQPGLEEHGFETKYDKKYQHLSIWGPHDTFLTEIRVSKETIRIPNKTGFLGPPDVATHHIADPDLLPKTIRSLTIILSAVTSKAHLFASLKSVTETPDERLSEAIQWMKEMAKVHEDFGCVDLDTTPHSTT